MRKHIIAALAALISIVAGAEVPSGYYSSLKGKSSADLKTALYEIINPHDMVSSYSDLPKYFQVTDVYPSNPNRWWDMYSNIPLYLPWNGSNLNREHCLPKSWWGGSTTTPAYVDLFHLYPSEAIANQRKSNYPLGVVTGTPYYDNGFIQVGKGVNSGGAQYVFEPNDEYKGDFARTYFYMVTCYQNMNWVTTWQVKNGTYPSLQDWAIDLLLQWHRQDPVSDKETNRNEAVFKFQNNRNPFIDDPELAEYIWGNKKGQAYQPTGTTPTPSGDGELFTPANGLYLDFNQVALSQSSTSTLLFKGENLSGTFTIRVIGANKSLFTISTSALSAAQANTQAGASLSVTYTPTSVGTHTARLSLSDGGMPDGWSRIIELRGECLEYPTLTAPTAYDAINVTDQAYTARWTSPSDEVVDYYMVTVKRYAKDGTVTTTEYPAETDTLDVDGLDLADYDSYAVQSVRLNVRSAMSNYVTVRPTASIDGLFADEPLRLESFYGVVRFRCSTPHTNVRVMDVAGRTIRVLAIIDDQDEIALPAGLYFIATDQHQRPLRTVVR